MAGGLQGTLEVQIKGQPYLLASSMGPGGGPRAAGARDVCAGATTTSFGYVAVLDLRDELNLKMVSRLILEVSLPSHCATVRNDPVQAGSYGPAFCVVDDPADAKLVACGYTQAGLRVFDIREPSRPREIAYYKPPASTAPPKPGSFNARSPSSETPRQDTVTRAVHFSTRPWRDLVGEPRQRLTDRALHRLGEESLKRIYSESHAFQHVERSGNGNENSGSLRGEPSGIRGYPRSLVVAGVLFGLLGTAEAQALERATTFNRMFPLPSSQSLSETELGWQEAVSPNMFHLPLAGIADLRGLCPNPRQRADLHARRGIFSQVRHARLSQDARISVLPAAS